MLAIKIDMEYHFANMDKNYNAGSIFSVMADRWYNDDPGKYVAYKRKIKSMRILNKARRDAKLKGYYVIKSGKFLFIDDTPPPPPPPPPPTTTTTTANNNDDANKGT